MKMGTTYVPIFALPKVSSSLLQLSLEEKCDVIPVVEEYLNEAPPQPHFGLGQTFKTTPLKEIKKLMSESGWHFVEYYGKKLIVTQFAIFEKLSDTSIKPIAVAMIDRQYIPYLKMSSLIEMPFPLDLIEIWFTEDVLKNSKTFQKGVRSALFSVLSKKEVVIKEVELEEFNKELFVNFKKPTFLARTQEKRWLKDMWNEFREKK